MFFFIRQSRSAPVPRASFHSSNPKKFRPARQSMPFFRLGSTALAKVISPVWQPSIWLSKSTWVLFSIEGYKTDLWRGARPTAGPRTGEGIFVDLLIGHIERAAIHAYQPPGSIPCPRVLRTAIGFANSSCNCCTGSQLNRVRACEMPDLPATPYPRRWIAEPLHSFQETAQDLAIGGLHIQSQSDHVVNHHLRWKIALTNTGLARPGQHRTDGRIRRRFGDDAKTDVVRDPCTRRKFRNRTRQLWPPVPLSCRMPQIFLSEQYYG
jgi:hypothetical protein